MPQTKYITSAGCAVRERSQKREIAILATGAKFLFSIGKASFFSVEAGNQFYAQAKDLGYWIKESRYRGLFEVEAANIGLEVDTTDMLVRYDYNEEHTEKWRSKFVAIMPVNLNEVSNILLDEAKKIIECRYRYDSIWAHKGILYVDSQTDLLP